MIALMLSYVLTTGSPAVKSQGERAEETARYILALKPSMDARRAKRLARQIDYWAGRYEVDPFLMAAIIRQESNFESIRACWPAPWKGEGATTCDHGLAQVNQTWIDKWKLDAQKLIDDDGYNIYIQARILAWIRHYHPAEVAWFSRYHSGTPSKRLEYQKQLQGFLALL